MTNGLVRTVLRQKKHNRLPFQLFYSNLFNIGKRNKRTGGVHDKTQ